MSKKIFFSSKLHYYYYIYYKLRFSWELRCKSQANNLKSFQWDCTNSFVLQLRKSCWKSRAQPSCLLITSLAIITESRLVFSKVGIPTPKGITDRRCYPALINILLSLSLELEAISWDNWFTKVIIFITNWIKHNLLDLACYNK